MLQKLHVSKNIFALWLYAHFCMILYMYIVTAGQTTHWGQKFDVNRKASSLWSFVASLKKISSTSDFIHIFSWFYKCVKPADKIWCQQKPLITSVICYEFQNNLFEVWFYTHYFMILYMYIALGQGQTTPWVQNCLLSSRYKSWESAWLPPAGNFLCWRETNPSSSIRFGFYSLSRLFHSFWAKIIISWGENGRSPRKKTWPPPAELGLSHMWLKLSSNPQRWEDKQFRALKISGFNHSATGSAFSVILTTVLSLNILTDGSAQKVQTQIRLLLSDRRVWTNSVDPD